MSLKKIILGSALTAATFGLVACGDDGPTNPAPGSSSSAPIKLEQTTELSPVTFSNMAISAQGLSTVKFGGTVNLNGWDSALVAQMGEDFNFDNVQFTGLSFTVANVNNGAPVTTNATVQTPSLPAFPHNRAMSLAEIGVAIDLSDAAFTDCGKFMLYATAKATDGKNNYVSRDSIAFSRADSWCAVKDPESAESKDPAAEIVLTKYEVKMATNDNMAIDLETGTTYTAADVAANKASIDLVFASVDGFPALYGAAAAAALPSCAGLAGAGPVYITKNINDEDNDFSDDFDANDMPEVVTMASFRYTSPIASQFIPNMKEASTAVYIVTTPAYNATTGAGYFLIHTTGMPSFMPLQNGEFSAKFVIYKK